MGRRDLYFLGRKNEALLPEWSTNAPWVGAEDPAWFVAGWSENGFFFL